MALSGGITGAKAPQHPLEIEAKEHVRSGRMDEALRCFRLLLDDAPTDARLWGNAALAANESRNRRVPEIASRRALILEPAHTHFYFVAVHIAQRSIEARERAERFITFGLMLNRDHQKLLIISGILRHQKGDQDGAKEHLSRALQLGAEDETAKHLLRSIERENAKTSSDGYVRSLFDGYAEQFKTHLVDRLNYRVPEIAAGLLEKLLQGTKLEHAIDFGCADGSGASHFTHLVNQIDGVDLAPKMIDEANNSGIYRNLYVGNPIQEPQLLTQATYDLAIVLDVMVYVGDPGQLFTCLRRLMKPKGYVVTSFERISSGFELQASGRFGHSVQSIQIAAHDHGFEEVMLSDCPIRLHGERMIPGFLTIHRLA